MPNNLAIIPICVRDEVHVSFVELYKIYLLVSAVPFQKFKATIFGALTRNQPPEQIQSITSLDVPVKSSTKQVTYRRWYVRGYNEMFRPPSRLRA